MNPLLATLALAAGFAGALLIYLGAPNQHLRARPLPFRPAMASGALILSASLAILLSIMGPAAALCAFAVLLMSVWTLAPFAALARRAPSGRRR